jgi:hypothetical protein
MVPTSFLSPADETAETLTSFKSSRRGAALYEGARDNPLPCFCTRETV